MEAVVKPGLSPNELRIVCTGRGKGEHTTIELALLVAGAAAPNPVVDLTWLATDAESASDTDQPGGLLAAMDRVEARARVEGRLPLSVAALPARQRPRSLLPKGKVVKHTRADGGVTFEFPACPKCKGRPRIIRDDKLAAFMRAAPGQNLDVSLLRWHNRT